MSQGAQSIAPLGWASTVGVGLDLKRKNREVDVADRTTCAVWFGEGAASEGDFATALSTLKLVGRTLTPFRQHS